MGTLCSGFVTRSANSVSFVISSSPLEMVATSKPPSTVPDTETRPPESSVPPIAGATKDDNTQSLPIPGEAVLLAATDMAPASAASRPDSP